MVIIGFDPGLAILGYGVIEKTGHKIKALEYGVITTDAKTPFPVRLRQLYENATLLIMKYKPDAIALEELFYNTNVKTAISVAQARGALLVAVSNYTDEIYEYTPLQIKQALVGYGRAEKGQVQRMVKTVLGLEKEPKPDDAADGLAAALCLANTYRPGQAVFKVK